MSITSLVKFKVLSRMILTGFRIILFVYNNFSCKIKKSRKSTNDFDDIFSLVDHGSVETHGHQYLAAVAEIIMIKSGVTYPCTWRWSCDWLGWGGPARRRPHAISWPAQPSRRRTLTLTALRLYNRINRHLKCFYARTS